MRVSKLKRAFVITAILLIIYMITNIFFSFNLASGDSNGQKAYKVIEVSDGDTLWSIAKEHTSKDEDIRDTVYLLKNVNHLESDIISEGDLLLMPV